MACPTFPDGELEFKALVKKRRTLFRVYTPRSTQQSAKGDGDPFFVAPKFDSTYTFEAQPLPSHTTLASRVDYDDVANHLDWTTRSASPFVSTSFSFTWSLWDAMRRYKGNFKHDVEIAAIDAGSVTAYTAAEILYACCPSKRHPNHWKWYQYACESQLVLVCGSIRKEAVLASTPLLPLLERLPSYFFDAPSMPGKNMMDRIPLDCIGRKPSFLRFCRLLSTRCSLQSSQNRSSDVGAISARLAFAFLRPWISDHVLENSEDVLKKVTELATEIASWPPSGESATEEFIMKTSTLLLDEVRQLCKEHEQAVSVILQRLDKHSETLLSEENGNNSLPQVCGQVPAAPAGPESMECLDIFDGDDRVSKPCELSSTDHLPVSKTSQEVSVSEDLTVEEPLARATILPPSLPSAPKNISRPSSPTNVARTSTSLWTPSAESASVVAGFFLVGAVLTLCVLSSQRRTLIAGVT